SNLRIRFSKGNSSQFRIDDLKVLADYGTSAAISASGPTTFCTNNTVTLTASANGSAYAWSSGQTTPSITVGSSGTYSVTITSPSGCTSSARQDVIVNPLPVTSDISGSSTFDAYQSGVTYSVTDTSGSSYAWTVPDGATITAGASGPDNNQITVTFGNF